MSLPIRRAGALAPARRHRNGVWIAASTVCSLLLAAGTGLAAIPREEALSRLRNATYNWAPGERIRVLSPSPYRIGTAGWFEALESDSVLRMRADRTEPALAFRLSQIGALEESAGRKRHTGIGALAGLGVGLIAGALVAEANRNPDSFLPGLENIAIPILGAAGLVVGGVAGYAITTERWQPAASFEE